MGPDGFVRAGVTGKGVEARESDSVSVLVSPAIDRCSSLISEKDVVSASESASWNKILEDELCMHDSEKPTFQRKYASERLSCEGTSSSLLLFSSPEVKELPWKAGKLSRSTSGCAKRMRMTQMKDSLNQDNKLNKLGLSNPNCTFTEKTSVVKQKNSLNGKRGDKRNSKLPIKSKCDPISLKPGSLSFNSAAGGSSIFGIYGLKSDLHDVTKHEDEVQLDALLDGSYKGPNLGKDKGRKTANLNENVLQSVRKAFSILQLPKPLQSHNIPETDNTGQKPPTCLLSSEPFTANSIDSDKGDACPADLATHNKIEESCSKANPTDKHDFPLYQPKDVLEHLALPPPCDLQSLLLETAKPTVFSSRNTSDVASVKPIPYRTNLPPFPWSGHCKPISDTAKLFTSRSTCQVRWVRIGNASTSVEGVRQGFPDLESLTYDHSLVPSLRPLEIQNPRSMSVVGLPMCERGLSSSGTFSATLQVLPGFGGHSLRDREKEEHCPKVLAAAQALCKIASSHSLKLKKPLQRDIKPEDPKLYERPREIFPLGDSVESARRTMPLKKPKLSVTEKRKDLGFARPFIKGPISWSTPKSTRSSPVKLLNDSLMERNNFNANAKLSSTRISSKVCNGTQKLRKLVPMDWSRGRGKLD